MSTMPTWEHRLRERQERALAGILPRIAPEYRVEYEIEKRRLHEIAVCRQREARLTGWVPRWESEEL